MIARFLNFSRENVDLPLFSCSTSNRKPWGACFNWADRRVFWTMLLHRLLENPALFNDQISGVPAWEYGVMAVIFVFSISPTLEFCGRIVIVDGWRSLLDLDSACSFIDIGYCASICWTIAYELSLDVSGESLAEMQGTRLSVFIRRNQQSVTAVYTALH
jgi:hypothetical protein